MNKKLLALFLVCLLPVALLAGSGDVNGDGKIDEKDVKLIADYIMGKSPENFNKDEADVNEDGIVNATDIVEVVNKSEMERQHGVTKKEFHLINNSAMSFSIEYSGDEEFNYEILDDGTNWIKHSSSWYAGSIGTISFTYDSNFTGKRREAQIAVSNKDGSIREIVRIIHHPAKLAYLSQWDHRFV